MQRTHTRSKFNSYTTLPIHYTVTIQMGLLLSFLINWTEVQLLVAQEWVRWLSDQHSPLLLAECLQRQHSVLLLVRLLTRTSLALQERGSPSLH